MYFAYVGPGVGINVLGALWGLIVTMGAAAGAVLWNLAQWIKRQLQKKQPLSSD
jgi:hypothetical protein